LVEHLPLEEAANLDPEEHAPDGIFWHNSSVEPNLSSREEASEPFNAW